MSIRHIEEELARERRYAMRRARKTLDPRVLAPLINGGALASIIVSSVATARLVGPERSAALAGARRRGRMIAEGTQRRISRSLSAGRSNGEKRSQLVRRVFRAIGGPGRARTIANTEYTVGAASRQVGRWKRAGATHVRLFDGPGCGIESHNDPRKANGRLVDSLTYVEHPLAHPNCRRQVVQVFLDDGRKVSPHAAELIGRR